NVDIAFTHSLHGLHLDYEEGNRRTIAAAQEHPWLLPVAVMDPRRFLGWEAEVERCLKAGVRVFCFFPEQQGWSVGTAPFPEMLKKIASAPDTTLMFSARTPGTAGAVARLTADLGRP